MRGEFRQSDQPNPGSESSPESGNSGADETVPLSPSSPANRVREAPGFVPRRIGKYRIKRAIASGGMGTVYEAVQDQPRRTVALKLMREGIASRSALRRFEYESQLLGRLRHPGIAQVHDAGTHTEGNVPMPYFVMEYIVGAMPVTAYARAKKLETRARLALFAEVCDAIHHGHQKGIIHRDLKPSNILVDSTGQVKIIDFGVARCTDSDLAVTTLQTGVGELIGTLQYMSPEQCAADPQDIDTRSDVYALGVVLYEVLCEQLPYDVKRAAIHEATRVIAQQAPARLSTVNRGLRGDIETIVLKALEKDRDRRYRSAAALADDIRRYLDGQPIGARPPSLTYQLGMFARRNKGAAAALLAIMLVLAGGLVVSDLQRRRAVRAETLARSRLEEAVAARDEAEAVVLFMGQVLHAADPEQEGRDVTVREVMDQAAARLGSTFAGKPLIEARLRRTIGWTYLGLAESRRSPGFTWKRPRRCLPASSVRTTAARWNRRRTWRW